MKESYIIAASAISAQNTFNSERLEAIIDLQEGYKWKARYPDFKDYISPIERRRMATGVKMGIATAKKALELARLETIDGIITGTGMGCIEDTEKFLNSMIANDEEFLTPTSFIQSTHNTVGSQIALTLKCKGYNNTFVQASNSFESALIDAQLLLCLNEATNILVGGVDELGALFIDYVTMIEKGEPNNIKVPFSEGASFFVLSSEKGTDAVRLNEIQTIFYMPLVDVVQRRDDFLNKHELKIEDIDIVITGNNGDGNDEYYRAFNKDFSDQIPILNYKQYSGEYFTVSAFGIWLGYTILKTQQIPAYYNPPHLDKKTHHILLYNQFKGVDHSFVLLSI